MRTAFLSPIVCAGLALGLSSATALPATAQPTLSKLALTGEQPPGAPAGSVYSEILTDPVINESGDAAFAGVVTLPDRTGRWTIWGTPGGGPLAPVIAAGDPVPGAAPGTELQVLGSPRLNDRGELAFNAALRIGTGGTTRNDDNVIMGPDGNGGLVVVAREGFGAPGIPGALFQSISTPLLNDLGHVLFTGRLQIGPGGVLTGDNEGLWGPTSTAALDLLARDGDPVPGAPPGTVYDDVRATLNLNDRDDASFGALIGPPGAIIGPGGSGLELLLTTGTQAPGTPPGTLFGLFTDHQLNDAGEMVIRGFLQPGTGDATALTNAGIWRRDPDGALELVARAGEQAPDVAAGAIFSGFFPPLLNEAGDIAWVATLRVGTGDVDPSNNLGIWGPDGDGGVGLIARTGDPAPDLPGLVLSGFGDLTLNDRGDLAVLATLAGPGVDFSNDDAILFVPVGGEPEIALRTGDALEVAPGDVRDIARLSFFAGYDTLGMRRSLNGRRELAVLVGFLDGFNRPAGIFILGFLPPVTSVDVDVKPGSDRNPVNPASRGVLSVAILGSESFDVERIDRGTLAFGPAEAEPAHRAGGHFEDVDGDGVLDLVSHYRVRKTGIAYGDTEACVTGKDREGQSFEGCDAIVTVPACGLGFEIALLLPLVSRLRTRRRSRAG